MISFFKKKKPSLPFIAFWQALGLVFYCGLVGLLFWKGDRLTVLNRIFLGPVLFLTVFVASALISTLVVLGYPVFLFWEKKQTVEAIKLAAYTAAWLILFIFLILLFVILA